jgi:hypothetical protein
MRWVWVKLPSFSVWAAAGMKKTSVPISAVFSSPVSISGPSFQNVAVSISTRSRTTSQSSLDRASRCRRPLADPMAGFWPRTKKPATLPSAMSMIVRYDEWSPVMNGR